MRRERKTIRYIITAFLVAAIATTVFGIYVTSGYSETEGEYTESADGESMETVEEDAQFFDDEVQAAGNPEYTNRDLRQEADLSSAIHPELASGEKIIITEAGTYVLSGEFQETSIVINAPEAEVQLVLDNLNITNTSYPAIYVKEADKTFITSAKDSENELIVNGVFMATEEANFDGVIFARDDLELNGLGSLNIYSTANGVVAKDDLKITDGSYYVTTILDSFEANNSIKVDGGNFVIDSSKDGFNCGYDETLEGTIHITGGNFSIDALRQGIQANVDVIIDGGDLNISAAEGIEATYIVINDGNINIYASDDGINATSLTYDVNVMIEINGGYITIVMGEGDTDALDANGNMVVNGGYLDITARSAFDYDYTGTYNGGTIFVNGTQVAELTPSMGGKGGRGNHGGF